MRGEKELVGTLRGFDEFVNMVRTESQYSVSFNPMFTKHRALTARDTMSLS